MLDDADAKTVNAHRNGEPALPEQVLRNVAAMMGMRHQTELDVGVHQRAIERVTALLGRPMSLYVVLAAVAVWTLANALGQRAGVGVPDPPPFFWLQGLIGLAALLVACLVLITQHRQARLIERRMHLDLQVNLLTEQKSAKLIELIEELRRDLPNVRYRRDSEAEAMQHAAQPLDVVAALDAHTLEAAADPIGDDLGASEPKPRGPPGR